jgi:hypothetical protein
VALGGGGVSDEPKKKRKKATSNVQRSLAHMRALGYTCATVERWNPHAMIRQDLFGGIDLLCLPPSMASHKGEGIVGIQCCSDNGGAVEEHRRKLLGLPAIRLWCEHELPLVIHGWGLRAMPRDPGAPRKGKRRKVWTLREVELTLADFDAPYETEIPLRGAVVDESLAPIE